MKLVLDECSVVVLLQDLVGGHGTGLCIACEAVNDAVLACCLVLNRAHALIVEILVLTCVVTSCQYALLTALLVKIIVIHLFVHCIVVTECLQILWVTLSLRLLQTASFIAMSVGTRCSLRFSLRYSWVLLKQRMVKGRRHVCFRSWSAILGLTIQPYTVLLELLRLIHVLIDNVHLFRSN